MESQSLQSVQIQKKSRWGTSQTSEKWGILYPMKTSKPKPKPDYSQWLTKQQAAEAIGCSTKYIELLASEKQIQMVKWKRPEGGPRINVYHPSDVESLRKKRNPDQGAFVVPAKEGKTSALVPRSKLPPMLPELTDAEYQAMNRFFRFQEMQALPDGSTSRTSQNVRIAERLFLTLREAAEYSGLPKAHILRLLKDKTLAGSKTGLGWRIPRAALEHYAYLAANEVASIEIPKDFQPSSDVLPATMS